MKVDKGKSKLGFLAICGISFFIQILMFCPGFLTADGVEALRQARAWVFSDWHPPIMSLVWAGLDHLVPGPLGMLLFHLSVFWSAIFILMVSWATHGRNKAWVGMLILLGFLPPILGHLGIILKDVGLGVCLLLSFAILHYSYFAKAKKTAYFALLPLFYSLSVRHNAFVSVIPFVVWMAMIVGTQKNRVRLSILFIAGLFLSGHVLNQVLVDQKTYPIQQLFTYDLSGISLDHDQPLYPEYLLKEPGFSFEKVRAGYTVWNPVGVPGIPRVSGSEQLNEQAHYWLGAIFKYFPSYLHHRWMIFRLMLGVGHNPISLPFFHSIVPNPWNYQYHPNFSGKILASYLDPLARSIWFRGWFYLITLVGISGAVFLKKKVSFDRIPLVFLILSGLAYIGFDFVVIPGADFRYLWWTMITALLSLFLLVFEGRSKN